MSEDDAVTSNKIVRQLEDRVRELERQLGRKTLEAEILGPSGTGKTTSPWASGWLLARRG